MTTPDTPESGPPTRSKDFIRAMISSDVEAGKHGGRVGTRFPPEPNGYLHIGHAKAILLNHAIAREFGGTFNLRFDDTNPTKEETEFVDGIMADIEWLGCKWDALFYASDYFETLYEWAVFLIKEGKAYVDSQTPDEIKATRGNPAKASEPGKNSPFRDRTPDENLDLFAKMRAGDFKDGECVLRAKIDMSHPNFNMRDPIMYRILHAHHHRTGNDWCLYPTYDWAHGESDSIEGITHSLCTLEFEHHRPLYDWFIEALAPLNVHVPRQTEFARLNISYMAMSKRWLRAMVADGIVSGWDEPRMPTLRGMKRRGYTPEAIRKLCDTVGLAKTNSKVEMALVEHCVREDLNSRASRMMAVLDPLKVVITNYPELEGDNEADKFEFPWHPDNPDLGTRMVPFGRDIYIERDDFREDPPKKFFRLAPGKEVRLRYAFFITCNEVIKDDAGNIVELRCTYDPASRGGESPDGRKVKGTLHWVSATHAKDVEVRLYDHLFKDPSPGAEREWAEDLNPDSLKVVRGKVEPAMLSLEPGRHVQFERIGYFVVDTVDSKPDAPVFNRTVALKDSWAKIEKRGDAT